MYAAILAIGTELTRGELVDRNSAWLSERLTALGLDVVEQVSVPDDDSRIAASLVRLGGASDYVMVTGGLGPTSDDRTSACAAVAAGVALVRDAEAQSTIEAYYLGRGRALPPAVLKQADFPDGAEVMANGVGTAPGFQLQVGRARCFFMPGVPAEMRHLFERHVEPSLSARVRRTTYQVHLRTACLPESTVAERLRALDAGGEREVPGVVIGYRARPNEVEVKVLARAESEAAAERQARRVADEAAALLAPHVYGGRGDSFPASVGQLLRDRGMDLALAESCTGGLISKLLTDAAGSSDFLRLSAVTYANSAKSAVLGVSADLLADQGAVSEGVAAAMADGARALVDTTLAVAVTGVAGPGGGGPEKPVGTVCFGLSQRGKPTRTERRLLSGDREKVRLSAAYHALQLVADAVRAG